MKTSIKSSINIATALIIIACALYSAGPISYGADSAYQLRRGLSVAATAPKADPQTAVICGPCQGGYQFCRLGIHAWVQTCAAPARKTSHVK